MVVYHFRIVFVSTIPKKNGVAFLEIQIQAQFETEENPYSLEAIWSINALVAEILQGY